MNLTMIVQVLRERRTQTRRRMIWKKRDGQVTKSHCPSLFIL